MMNTRVLELLKNPKNIQSEDLYLLKEEINSFPYIQNIRALHLYGVHLFDKENYQKELSTTAAYTTDKKILYQLINGKIEHKKPEKSIETPEIKNEEEHVQQVEEIVHHQIKKEAPKHDYEAVSEALIIPKPEIKQVFVNGERNRILFEGEENFLDDTNTEKIDLESTLESGVIVTQKPILNEEITVEADELNIEKDFIAAPSENIISEDAIDSQKNSDKINDENEVSFQKIESFSAEGKEIVEGKSNVSEVIENEGVSGDLNIEAVINEDKIDSEKVEEKINDESELSFIKIESLKTTETSEPFVEDESISKLFESEDKAEVLNSETIIEEDKINSEQETEKIVDSSELSFHGTDSFLPDVKIESSNAEQKSSTENFRPNLNKHEEEMRRLIEEVEKKMRAQKKDVEENHDISENDSNNEISFAETQAFHVGEEQKAAEETVVKMAESIVEETLEEQNSDLEIEESLNSESENQVNSSWKPMNFESHTPDSLSRKVEVQSQPIKKIIESASEENNSEETINEAENIEENIETETFSQKDDEVPVMNFSFFGNDISSLSVEKQENKPEKIEEEVQEQQIPENESKNSLDSNVPGFINTWQSWLKIDRTEEVEKAKTETKNKAIESFIENNPKISQLKDEVNFVVKEKTDDISHLMTETLANLYIEQKLYTKAINAFQILVNKYPDRKEYFESKIQEIKDSRGKN